MCALSKALSVRPDRRSSLWVWLSRVYQQTWVEWCELLQVVFLELGDSDQSWRLLFEMLILPAYSLAQCVGPSEGAWTAGQSQQYRLWSLKSTLRYVCFWSKYCPKDLCASLCQRNACIWVPIKTVWGDSSVRKVPVLQVWRSEFESQYPCEKPGTAIARQTDRRIPGADCPVVGPRRYLCMTPGFYMKEILF